MTASTCKAQATAINRAAGKVGRPVGKRPGNFHFHQICDSATAGANEVYMGIGIGIESLHALNGGDDACQSLLPEQIEIAVHRTHGQVGNLLLQIRINRFRRGVRLGLLQVMQDRVPFAKLLLGNFHVITSMGFLNENDSHL